MNQIIVVASNNKINIFVIQELNLQSMAANSIYLEQIYYILKIYNKEQLCKVQQNRLKSGEDLNIGLILILYEEFRTQPAFSEQILKDFSSIYFLLDVKILEIEPKILIQFLAVFYGDNLRISVLNLDLQYKYIPRLTKELKVSVLLYQDLPYSLGYILHIMRCSSLVEY